MQAYRNEKARDKVLFTELRHVADASESRATLEHSGFKHEEHLNLLIDLTRPIDETWSHVAPPARRAVARSVRRGLVVEEMTDRTCLPVMYELLSSTFQHAQVPLADISLFEAAFDVLVSKGMARILLARADGQYASTIVQLLYKGTIFVWYMGFDKAMHDFYPNDAITWTSLQWGSEHGFSTFDWGGAGRPNQPYGPRNFKAKYGGRLVNYGRATYVHRPFALALSRIGYAVYRRALSANAARTATKYWTME